MSSLPEPVALHLLVAVADHGSLSAAARAAGVTQPNASRSLARLERHLGLSLLTRSTTGSRLTPQGLLVVEWARDVLRGYATLRDGAAALAAQGETRLRVGASQTIAEHLLPAWLGAIRGTPVTVTVENSAEVVAELRAGRIDLGFVEGPDVPADLHHETVAHDELVLVVAPDHPWAGVGAVGAQELVVTPLVTREPGSGTRIALDAALGRPAPCALEVASNAAVRVAVAAGVAPAVLSRLAVAEGLASGTLVQVPLRDLDLRRTLRAVWSGPRLMRGAAAELVSIARRASLAQQP